MTVPPGTGAWESTQEAILAQLQAGGTSGTQYTDGSAAPTHPIGTQVVFNNAGTETAVSNSAPLPITGSISASNPSVGTDGSAAPASSTQIGGSDGTNLQGALVESSSHPNLRMGIYQAGNEATVTQFHSADNQSLGSGNGLLTGGVAQILNPGGLLDRQRGTGLDAVAAVGIPSGSQQLAGPALTTTFNGAVTGSSSSQSIVLASTASLKAGDIITTSDNVESTEVVTVDDGTHIHAILKNNHANGQSITWYHFNQARDATVGDMVSGTGLSPSATYLYNSIAGNFEFDRSANGEKDGASGQGTAVAAEYEWNAGGPLNNSNVISGLQFDRARNVQGKALGSGSISNNPLAAGSTTLTLNSAPTTLMAGQQIILDRAGANPEANYVGTGYTAGSTSVPLQNATAFSHAQNSTVEWDQFSGLGPGLNGFTAAGVGIEEEALYNPVDGKFYLERSATGDGVAAANVVMENPAIWNGSTMDRWKGSAGAGNVSLQASGSISATLQSAASTNGNGTVLSVLGMSTVVFTITGSFSALINFEGNEDGSTFNALEASQLGINFIGTASGGTGVFVASCAGLQQIRARISGYSSGNVTVSAHAIPQTFAPWVVNSFLVDSGGTNKLGIDAGGRLTSIIQAVGGTALAADQSNTELRTSIYGKNSTAGDTPILLGSAGQVAIQRNSVAVYTLASTQTSGSTQNSGDLTVGPYTEISIDINTTAQSGTNPTIQYFWERKGADGIYYVLWQSAVLTAATNTLSTSIGAGMAYNQSLGLTGRLRWIVGGTATPTFTHSLNVYGK